MSVVRLEPVAIYDHIQQDHSPICNFLNRIQDLHGSRWMDAFNQGGYRNGRKNEIHLQSACQPTIFFHVIRWRPVNADDEHVLVAEFYPQRLFSGVLGGLPDRYDLVVQIDFSTLIYDVFG